MFNITLTRAPIITAVISWLKESSSDIETIRSRMPLLFWKALNSNIAVTLETPNEEWFQSIKGYEIIDRNDVDRFPHIDLLAMSFLVYEKSTSDTVHTVRQLLERGIVKADKICALCPKYEGANEFEELGLTHIKTVCSSEVCSQLLAWVRQQAIDGKSSGVIQQMLDEDLGDIIESFLLNKNRQIIVLAEQCDSSYFPMFDLTNLKLHLVASLLGSLQKQYKKCL